jgi:predicted DNA-binding transcriptional regulator AlpA
MRSVFQTPPDRLVSEKVAAEILGIHAATLRRLGARGEGPTRRKISPRRVGYRLSEITAYRDGQPLEPSDRGLARKRWRT